MALDVSGMKISFHGQELKAVKEISIPPDMELPEELPPGGHINGFPDEVYGKMKFKPKPIAGQGIRWRTIKKAYKMMGVSRTEALLRILGLFVVDDTEEISKARSESDGG